MWYLFANWLSQHKDLAAWIQLISSTIGLGIAIAVPWSLQLKNTNLRRGEVADKVRALLQVFQTVVEAAGLLMAMISESHNPENKRIVVILVRMNRYDALWAEISSIPLASMPTPETVSKLVDCKHAAEEVILSVRQIQQEIDAELTTSELSTKHLHRSRDDLAREVAELRELANLLAKKPSWYRRLVRRLRSII